MQAPCLQRAALMDERNLPACAIGFGPWTALGESAAIGQAVDGGRPATDRGPPPFRLAPWTGTQSISMRV